MSERTCVDCGSTYPLDKKHFRWKDDKFTNDCRLCRSKKRAAARDRKKVKQQNELEQIEAGGVDLFLKSISKGGSNIPHSAELIEKVFEYFGGVSGFSAVVVKQYWDSKPGSSARNRLLETMCRLVSKNVEQGGARKPLSLWSEEELEQELDSRFKQAVAAYAGVTVDAISQEEAPKSLPAPDPECAGPDAVPAGFHQGIAGGTQGSENRGTEAVPRQPDAGADSRLQGE
jgi:hypothetical protein